MSRQNVYRLLALLAVLAVAGMIFFFSAQSAKSSSNMSGRITEALLRIFVPGYDALPQSTQKTYKTRIEHVVRKLAHFFEYVLLALWATICLHVWFPKLRPRAYTLLGWLLSVLYAGTDELHQRFVKGRGPALADVGIDALGALAGALLAMLMIALLAWHIANKQKRKS